jgi:hypothetical protein
VSARLYRAAGGERSDDPLIRVVLSVRRLPRSFPLGTEASAVRDRPRRCSAERANESIIIGSLAGTQADGYVVG